MYLHELQYCTCAFSCTHVRRPYRKNLPIMSELLLVARFVIVVIITRQEPISELLLPTGDGEALRESGPVLEELAPAQGKTPRLAFEALLGVVLVEVLAGATGEICNRKGAELQLRVDVTKTPIDLLPVWSDYNKRFHSLMVATSILGCLRDLRGQS